MVKKILKSVDYGLLIICVILFGIGIVALYSANGGPEGDISETIKQVAWFFVGFLCMAVIIFIDYDILCKLWIPLYRRDYDNACVCIVYSTHSWCN